MAKLVFLGSSSKYTITAHGLEKMRLALFHYSRAATRGGGVVYDGFRAAGNAILVNMFNLNKYNVLRSPRFLKCRQDP